MYTVKVIDVQNFAYTIRFFKMAYNFCKPINSIFNRQKKKFNLEIYTYTLKKECNSNSHFFKAFKYRHVSHITLKVSIIIL